MSLSRSPSPLPKLPFLIADAAFLAAAWLIADSSRHPLGSAAIAGIAGCAAGAAVCGAIPFITDYSRRQEAALDERQRSLEALSQTVATAAEQIGIAASGLHEIAELAQRNLREAEQLPGKLAEQIAEIEAKFNASRDDNLEEVERELATLRASESERLEATAQKIARAATDWAKAESFGLRHVVAAKTFIAELEQKTATLRSVLAAAPAAKVEAGAARLPSALEAPPKIAPAPEPAAAEPAPAPPLPQPFPRSEPEPEPEPGPEAAAPAADLGAPRAEEAPAPAVPAEPPPAPKPKRVAKRPYDPQEAIPGLELPDETAQFSPEAAAPVASTSADGATRLVVTSYIGIGNRLFIRGEGPGLSWEEGVPLQFVSIGKWRWETAHATAPVRFKLYKNDRDECPSLAADSIEPGRQQELTARF